MSLSNILIQTTHIKLMYRLLSAKVGISSQERLQRILSPSDQSSFVHLQKLHHDIVLTDNVKVKAQLPQGTR